MPYLHEVIEHLSARLDALGAGAESPRPSRYVSEHASEEHVRKVASGGGFSVVAHSSNRPTGEPRRPLGQFLRKALLESSGGGQYLVPPEHASFVWDRLASSSVGLRSGFTVLQTRRDELHIPRLAADAAANWTSEATAITASDPGFAEVVATPRKLAALVALSNEIRKDSDPSVMEVMANNLIRALALKLDLGFYEGSGTAPEIRGLKNVSGIQSISMGTNGAAFTNLDTFADGIGLLEQSSATASAIVMHPRTWQSLSKLKEQTSGSNKPILMESAGSGGQPIERRIYGLPVFLSSQLSITETQGTANNATSAYIYEASEVVAVRREEATIEVDSSRRFHEDMSELRCLSRWDLVVPNPAAVLRIQGIIP